MSQAYAVADSAHSELAALRAELLASVNHRRVIADGPLLVLATPEIAKRIYWRRVREIIAKSYVAVQSDRDVAIQCGSCREVSIVKADVVSFRCRCLPHLEQFAHKCRQITL